MEFWRNDLEFLIFTRIVVDLIKIFWIIYFLLKFQLI